MRHRHTRVIPSSLSAVRRPSRRTCHPIIQDPTNAKNDKTQNLERRVVSQQRSSCAPFSRRCGQQAPLAQHGRTKTGEERREERTSEVRSKPVRTSSQGGKTLPTAVYVQSISNAAYYHELFGVRSLRRRPLLSLSDDDPRSCTIILLLLPLSYQLCRTNDDESTITAITSSAPCAS